MHLRHSLIRDIFFASILEENVREYQSVAKTKDESLANFQVQFQRLADYAGSIAAETEKDKIIKSSGR